MFNILLTGAKGQLGLELQELSENYPEWNFFFTDKNTLDITDKVSIKDICKLQEITHIINCAAYTAVDKSETDKESANAINHIAVRNLAEISKENNIKLIHISTDYVFDGKNFKPYVETDTVNPQGVYGQTKLEGEEAMLKINPENSIIIRTSWVYSTYGENFVKTMLRLGKERSELSVIFDQVGTPTYARDLAETIMVMLPQISNENVEFYHYSNEGVCSWYDFAKTIFKLSDIQCNVKPIETKEYPSITKRPHYSLLNKGKIKERFGLIIPYWKDSLEDCIKKIGVQK